MKRKDEQRSLKKNGLANGVKMKDPVVLEDEGLNPCSSEVNGNLTTSRKLPRRAAAVACSKFKPKSIEVPEESLRIEVKRYPEIDDEFEAVKLTATNPDSLLSPTRKLFDFILFDVDAKPQVFEMCEFCDLYINAVIMPIDDDMEKDKDRGIRCKTFGRMESWSISGYDEGSPKIWISTAVSSYVCVRSAASYRKLFDLFYQKACVCVEVYKRLARSKGGDPNLNVEELVATVVRSLGEKKGFPTGSSGMDFVTSIGDFVYNQLTVLDDSSEDDGISFATLPVLIALRDQCRETTGFSKFLPTTSNAKLKIGDGGRLNDNVNDDEKMAWLLQEEENWKLTKRQNNRQTKDSKKTFYIKINEDEIAGDYPLPAYYKPSVQEMDEYIFCMPDLHYHDLPTRMLNNWSLYNTDSRLISLELLPMKGGAENDVTIFGSGYFREVAETEFGFELEQCQGSGSSSKAVGYEGIPVYLCSIKEWMIEFGSNMIFIWIRTDIAWYKLENPTKQYAPWYEPIKKTARLAISIIGLLKEETRVSRLSFSNVVKKVSEFDKHHLAYISSNPAQVERFIVVHGQIILQLFDTFPDRNIRSSAFATFLLEKMEQRHHTKLTLKKKMVLQKEKNLNPSASMVPIQSKRKAMRATMTRLINRIWSGYYSKFLPQDLNGVDNPDDKDLNGVDNPDEKEEEDVEEDNEMDDGIISLQEEIPEHLSSLKLGRSKSDNAEIKWRGESRGKTSSGDALHTSAMIQGGVVDVGTVIAVDTDEMEELQDMIYVEYMFENSKGDKMVHGRVMIKSSHTVLGNAANERELFLTYDCKEFNLLIFKEIIAVDIQKITWGHKYRKEYANQMSLAKEEEKVGASQGTEYYCKSLYCPQRGAFLVLPFDTMGLGSGTCCSCKTKEEIEEFKLYSSNSSFVYKNTKYSVDDFVYIKPECFGESEDDSRRFKAGRNVGLKPYVICRLLEINPNGSKKPTAESTLIKVRRFFRPDDVSTEKAYCSDIREIYYSDETASLPLSVIEGKCEVKKRSHLPSLELPLALEHTFFCDYSIDPSTGAIMQLPHKIQNQLVKDKVTDVSTLRENKRKGKCIATEQNDESGQNRRSFQENCLATLDIFAGCGGLSEGLEQSGVSHTKWAIEYEQPAGEAFAQNHPNATVFVDNCNVILRAIMEKCGDSDECISTAEATELAAKLDDEKCKKLPLPGQVDFINGGPPCQGFSGMNRFNTGKWSKVQCEMILAFLSFADYFRPRFFLLENVRTFISFNKGQTFRLTLASLLEMGYQVRFGILEAGAYGVSQSRKRAFIWAASPNEKLPEWPEPMHVFAGPELKISLPGKVQYAALRSTAGGAPFRSITVRDAIGDLPPVGNGASKPDIEYGGNPLSWFQKQIRGSMLVLQDHISKEMNELNLIRCQHIPKRPGSDWRDLPEKKVKLSSGQMVDIIPWCLPNTAKRHNQWKGLYGRLDWEGNFPTSTTDPQPMGKVGMCFHPEQDRIITVRECARSQGFPDSYRFAGNIQSKHRQIGNAVPPPLAYALGRKLMEVLDLKRSSS